MNDLLISHSQMSKFEECPRRWYYEYVRKIKLPVGGALIFGRKVHSMLEAKLQSINSKIYTPTDFSYDKDDPTSAYKSAVKLTQAGIDILYNNDILGFPGMTKLKSDSIEWRFLLSKFRGVIDLNFINKDKQHIILDWKTTSKKYKKHDIKTSAQLTAYAWAYKKLKGIIPHLVGYITLDKKSHKASLYLDSRTKDDIKEYEERVNRNYIQMLKQDNHRKESGCNGPYGRCPFYNRCWKGDTITVIEDSGIMKIPPVVPTENKPFIDERGDWF